MQKVHEDLRDARQAQNGAKGKKAVSKREQRKMKQFSEHIIWSILPADGWPYSSVALVMSTLERLSRKQKVLSSILSGAIFLALYPPAALFGSMDSPSPPAYLPLRAGTVVGLRET